MRLILFDVDGTLVDCGPQVRPLFGDALIEVYGTAGDLDGYDFVGKTDPQIVFELMSGAGLARAAVEAALPRFRDLYLERLRCGLARERMRLLPAVVELLERLAARDGEAALGLLTGNWEPGARAKLARFDLNRFFPFGAYGCDAADRAALPPVALGRAARAMGREFAPEETLIVGDSVHDVACARAHGIPCLAVATGRTPAAALAAAGATWVVPDLSAAGGCDPLLRR
ncbi:MAG TPA: HAD family hydrolase [Thermoanaerobaculia bacterium]|nr:HAD family hydrolase [Thermoanaerobaculia bacterium]